VIPLADFAPTAPAGTVSDYLKLSGTSASAPVVAGAAALMIGADPSLTPDDVKVRLMGTADPVAGATEHQQGAGTLDVDEALAATAHASGWALSATLGDGREGKDKNDKKHFNKGDYSKWEKQAWQKYGWTKVRWTKIRWTEFKWTKIRWTKVAWTKVRWTKVRWTSVPLTQDEYDWLKIRWTILIKGQ